MAVYPPVSLFEAPIRARTGPTFDPPNANCLVLGIVAEGDHDTAPPAAILLISLAATGTVTFANAGDVVVAAEALGPTRVEAELPGAAVYVADNRESPVTVTSLGPTVLLRLVVPPGEYVDAVGRLAITPNYLGTEDPEDTTFPYSWEFDVVLVHQGNERPVAHLALLRGTHTYFDFREPDPMPVGDDGMVLLVRPGPDPITGTWDFSATAALRVTGPITRQP